MTQDPYFMPEYVRVNESIEGGCAAEFRFAGAEGDVSHQFIMRPIEAAEDGSVDLITPYGYGGPVIRTQDGADPERLVGDFCRSFAEYCGDMKVVSEFVRFHPLEDAARYLESVYDISLTRTTVATALTGIDVLNREFSKSTRKKIRRNERSGVSASLVDTASSMDDFKRLYAGTMDRNEAADFYYFDDEYFDALITGMPDNVRLFEAQFEGATIASALCLVGGDRIHIHLSGTDTRYLGSSPAYSIRNAIAEWGLNNNMTVIHHGGGRSNDPEDSLLQYKRQFGSLMLNFYTGRRIWNTPKYLSLCEQETQALGPTGFFPAYRVR